MSEPHSLRAQYESFLHRNGMSIPQPDHPGAALLASISDSIRQILALGGIDLLGEVYVAPFPHRSFNAHAVAVDGGALILINTGFLALVTEVMKAQSASLQTCTFNDDWSVDRHVPTEEFRTQETTAYNALARSLLAYVEEDEPWVGEPLVLHEEWRLVNAEYCVYALLWFAVAHEFGHVLAGHLAPSDRTATSGDWIPRRWQEELEADQVGALITLRRIDEDDDHVLKYFTTSGPFTFFAIDHLITRVRNEVVGIPHGLVNESHPPSDERAGALRDLFVGAHGASIMHVADSIVHWMAWREESILGEAGRLMSARHRSV